MIHTDLKRLRIDAARMVAIDQQLNVGADGERLRQPMGDLKLWMEIHALFELIAEWRDSREEQGPQNDFRAEAEADERASRAEEALLAAVAR